MTSDEAHSPRSGVRGPKSQRKKRKVTSDECRKRNPAFEVGSLKGGRDKPAKGKGGGPGRADDQLLAWHTSPHRLSEVPVERMNQFAAFANRQTHSAEILPGLNVFSSYLGRNGNGNDSARRLYPLRLRYHVAHVESHALPNG